MPAVVFPTPAALAAYRADHPELTIWEALANLTGLIVSSLPGQPITSFRMQEDGGGAVYLITLQPDGSFLADPE